MTRPSDWTACVWNSTMSGASRMLGSRWSRRWLGGSVSRRWRGVWCGCGATGRGAANAARKVMALLFAMVLGADSIEDTGVLRAGRTRRLLGGWLPALSTLGTFLRAFTFGHV